MVMVIRVLEAEKTYICVSAVMGLLAFVETFITIDPVSLTVFTRVNTGKIPMVWTAATRNELEYMDTNVGDFGYYNYQYTYMDKAVDKMLDRVDYQGWYRVVSSFVEQTEDQFVNPDLLWDSVNRVRTYKKRMERSIYMLYSVFIIWRRSFSWIIEPYMWRYHGAGIIQKMLCWHLERVII